MTTIDTRPIIEVLIGFSKKQSSIIRTLLRQSHLSEELVKIYIEEADRMDRALNDILEFINEQIL